MSAQDPFLPSVNLYPALPTDQAFRERLLQAGKNKIQVVGAVMHQLIRVIYGVLTSGQPFDPAKLMPCVAYLRVPAQFLGSDVAGNGQNNACIAD